MECKFCGAPLEDSKSYTALCEYCGQLQRNELYIAAKMAERNAEVKYVISGSFNGVAIGDGAQVLQVSVGDTVRQTIIG